MLPPPELNVTGFASGVALRLASCTLPVTLMPVPTVVMLPAK